MSAFAPLAWDPHNDQFVRPLRCPQIACGAPSGFTPDEHDALARCEVCGRVFEVARLTVGEGAGAFSVAVARRAMIAACTVSGKRLRAPSLLDWAGAGGGPTRAATLPDRRGQVFGEPTRDVGWGLEAGWSELRWGRADSPRPDEMVTSLSVFRGVVVATSAQGTVGLFNAVDGTPILEHPLSWPGVDLDDDDHARAVRMPPALQATSMVLTTDRTALFRDLATSIFPLQRGAGAGLFVERPAARGRQWVGPALACGLEPRVVLVEAGVAGAEHLDAPQLVVFDLAGTELARVDAPDLARPPAWDPASGRVFWVTALGHVCSLDPSRPASAQTSLPGEMLALSVGERPHLAISSDVSGGSELWLADDSGGHLRVWRAPVARTLDGAADWSWEPMFEHKDTGALRGMAVGGAGRDRKNVSAQHLVLSTERATSALSRAVKGSASDVVLSRAPIAPPVLTSVGFLSQDKKGLWLRALPPWAFRDKNPERFLEPPDVEGRPAFYDRTIAVHGRQVFYAHGGRICEARLARSAVVTNPDANEVMP